jgi:hypothetical protein
MNRMILSRMVVISVAAKTLTHKAGPVIDMGLKSNFLSLLYLCL